MLEAAVGAVWSSARGWLTPPVLFVFINLVIGTIAVMSRLVSSSSARDGGGGGQRSLMRAPSVAFDRLRCFSFSRLGLPVDHAEAASQYPAFDDGAAGVEAEAAASPVYPAPEGGEWRQMSLLRRAPSAALDRIRGFSFSRRGPAADDAHVDTPREPTPDDDDAEPSSLPPKPAEAGLEHEQAGIGRSQSEAAAAAEAPAARRRARARRTRKARTAGEQADDDVPGTATTGVGEGGAGGLQDEPPVAVEVDARADDFIRQFREQLRLQRLDSILRYNNDPLRRTGTV